MSEQGLGQPQFEGRFKMRLPQAIRYFTSTNIPLGQYRPSVGLTLRALHRFFQVSIQQIRGLCTEPWYLGLRELSA